jgi:hypothetical protein
MNKEKFYGATYSVEKDSFGEITGVFEVEPDWDGFRFHGYCRPSQAEIDLFMGGQQ